MSFKENPIKQIEAQEIKLLQVKDKLKIRARDSGEEKARFGSHNFDICVQKGIIIYSSGKGTPLHITI